MSTFSTTSKILAIVGCAAMGVEGSKHVKLKKPEQVGQEFTNLRYDGLKQEIEKLKRQIEGATLDSQLRQIKELWKHGQTKAQLNARKQELEKKQAELKGKQAELKEKLKKEKLKKMPKASKYLTSVVRSLRDLSEAEKETVAFLTEVGLELDLVSNALKNFGPLDDCTEEAKSVSWRSEIKPDSIETICYTEWDGCMGNNECTSLKAKLEGRSSNYREGVLTTLKVLEHRENRHHVKHHAHMQKQLGQSYGVLGSGYLTFYTITKCPGLKYWSKSGAGYYTALVSLAVLFVGVIMVACIYKKEWKELSKAADDCGHNHV